MKTKRGRPLGPTPILSPSSLNPGAVIKPIFQKRKLMH